MFTVIKKYGEGAVLMIATGFGDVYDVAGGSVL